MRHVAHPLQSTVSLLTLILSGIPQIIMGGSLSRVVDTDRSNPFRSANLPIRDILFPTLVGARNPAGSRPFGSFVRTTGAGSKPDFGPFPLWPLSLTQPNHDPFGTDVGS
jgi:hypothetical protein